METFSDKDVYGDTIESHENQDFLWCLFEVEAYCVVGFMCETKGCRIGERYVLEN